MYQIKVPGAARKDIKGLPKSVQQELAKHLDKLSSHPKAGEPLHGVLKGFWKYAFSLEGTEYRIAYQIFPKQQLHFDHGWLKRKLLQEAQTAIVEGTARERHTLSLPRSY